MSNDETQDVIIDDPEWDTILRESELSPYKRDDIHTFTIDLFFVFNILIVISTPTPVMSFIIYP